MTVGRALPSVKFVCGSTLGRNFDKILECTTLLTSHLLTHWNICPSVHPIQSGVAPWRHLPLLYRTLYQSFLQCFLCVVLSTLPIEKIVTFNFCMNIGYFSLPDLRLSSFLSKT